MVENKSQARSHCYCCGGFFLDSEMEKQFLLNGDEVLMCKGCMNNE